ncbi:MAG: DsbA family oxidoreductase [Fusobacteriaceae bacterium]
MKVGIIIDFVCPYCYIATEIMWKTLGDEWEKKEIEWFPFELSPAPEPQGLVTPQRKDSFQKNFIPWANSLEIAMNFPTISPIPRTALVFEGVKFAQSQNLSSQFVRKVFEAYWIENKDISDIEILSTIAENCRLNKELFKISLLQEEFKEIHKKQNSEVSEWDFEVVPTFYIDEIQISEFPRTLENMKKLFY